ncbi:Fizzy-related [Chionoecetes opilio]|uniref:Fizzy-related n=1 Tax=Chionoecetes opilio TaxID=41210 RepID=A0A8J4YR14_CHIOP|nr:Fizzy-related [Chionoecetes opilio]
MSSSGTSIEDLRDTPDERRALSPYRAQPFSPRKNQQREDTLSPYSLSPVSAKSQKLLRSPRKAARKISKIPFKVLDAPELQDDFYLNLVDWSSQNVLSVGLGHCVYLWSAYTSQVTRLCDLSPDGDTVTSVSWSERGNQVAVGTHKGLVQVWDVASSKRVCILNGHTARVGALAWNGDVLSSGSRDRLILQRDVRTPCIIPDRRLAGTQAGAIAWSPHHHGLLASGGGTADRCIRFWNTLTGQPMQCVDTGSQVCNLAWSKHASELVSTHGYSQNQILVWRYPLLAQVAKLTGHTYRVLYLAMSPDGEAIVTGAGDETLRFWNVFSKARSQKVRVETHAHTRTHTHTLSLSFFFFFLFTAL